MQQEWVKEAHHLFNLLLKSCLKKEGPVEKSVEEDIKKEVAERVIRHYNNWEGLKRKRESLSLRRAILLEKIDKSCVKDYGEPFLMLPSEKQKAVVYFLGYDLRYPWFVDLCEYVSRQGRDVGYFLVGNERCDGEWVRMRVGGVKVSSMGAQIRHKGDASLENELERMGA